jgi:hypothetical protein
MTSPKGAKVVGLRFVTGMMRVEDVRGMVGVEMAVAGSGDGFFSRLIFTWGWLE